ncbi:MAG: hypothetical protein NZL85_05915, partial [Fimbriimonadales bacterium]|nr:hypothetical protein [Fimbriimonadales bacterium]
MTEALEGELPDEPKVARKRRAPRRARKTSAGSKEAQSPAISLSADELPVEARTELAEQAAPLAEAEKKPVRKRRARRRKGEPESLAEEVVGETPTLREEAIIGETPTLQQGEVPAEPKSRRRDAKATRS